MGLSSESGLADPYTFNFALFRIGVNHAHEITGFHCLLPQTSPASNPKPKIPSTQNAWESQRTLKSDCSQMLAAKRKKKKKPGENPSKAWKFRSCFNFFLGSKKTRIIYYMQDSSVGMGFRWSEHVERAVIVLRNHRVPALPEIAQKLISFTSG